MMVKNRLDMTIDSDHAISHLVMDLLVFAHRGEAAAWLNQPGWKHVDSSFHLNLYMHASDHKIILICGEGRTLALTQTLLAIQFLQSKYEIKQLINIGVAAAIQPAYELGEMIEVGTVYSQGLVGGFEFESITLNTNLSSTCISTHQRILNQDQRSEFESHAELIDRELWAIAYAAKKCSIKIKSYKYLIDRADQANICEWTKEHSKELSLKIYSAYDLIENNTDFSGFQVREAKLNQKNTAVTLVDQLKQAFDLHVSKSQQDQLKKLFTAYQQKTKLSDGRLVDRLKKDLSLMTQLQPTQQKKQRTKILIQHLDRALNPIKGQCYDQAKRLFNSLQSDKIKFGWDPQFEKDHISLQASLNSQQDINSLIQQLSELKYKDWQNVLDGKSIDV